MAFTTEAEVGAKTTGPIVPRERGARICGANESGGIEKACPPVRRTPDPGGPEAICDRSCTCM